MVKRAVADIIPLNRITVMRLKEEWDITTMLGININTNIQKFQRIFPYYSYRENNLTISWFSAVKLLLMNWRDAPQAQHRPSVPPAAWRGSSNAGNFLPFLFLELSTSLLKQERWNSRGPLNFPPQYQSGLTRHACCSASSKHFVGFLWRVIPAAPELGVCWGGGVTKSSLCWCDASNQTP